MAHETTGTAHRNPFQLWTAAQACEALNLSARTLWRLTQCGDVPSIHVGRSVRYDPDALRDWARARSQGGRSNEKRAPRGAQR